MKFGSGKEITVEDFQYNWFIFDIVTKSMTLKLIESGDIHNGKKKQSLTANIILLSSCVIVC